MVKGDVPHHDKPKFTVINEKLITECVYIPPSMNDEDKRSRDRGAEIKKDHHAALEFHEVEWLIFSYRNIAQIDNLVGFANLKRLQLDNNGITKIENLGHLTHLVWLDLSFNKITKIENLEALTQLEDLSLFANQIREIEGLDALHALTCLSLGKNSFESMDEIPKLHKFKTLRMLTLSGNKICNHPNYKSRILAYVRNLKFLDARMVVLEEVTKARDDTRELLLNQEEKDLKEEEDAKAKIESDREEAENKRANLGGIRTLFHEMTKEEPQVEHRSMHAFSILEPQGIPLRDELTRYADLFEAKIKDFTERMRELRGRKDTESNDFSLTALHVKRETDDKCKELVKIFEKRKKAIIPMGILVNKAKFKATPGDLEKLKYANKELRARLLDIETDQQEANLDLIEAYDRILEQIKSEGGECISQYFEELRGYERNFRDNVQKIFDGMVDDRAKEQQASGPDGGPPSTAYTGIEASADAKATLLILDSKEEWTKMLAEAHDSRNKRLEETEETLKGNEDKERVEITDGNNRREHERNRTRCNEVVLFAQLMVSQIEEWE